MLCIVLIFVILDNNNYFWIIFLYDTLDSEKQLEPFLVIKPTRCTNFSNLFEDEILYVSDNSSIHHQEYFTVHTEMVYVLPVCRQLASCQQTCMTYTIVVCTVKKSWRWTEELSETCRVSFQNKFEKLVHLVGFFYKKFITMHGHMNINLSHHSSSQPDMLNKPRKTSKGGPCGICPEQTRVLAGSSLNTSVFPCQLSFHQCSIFAYLLGILQ